MWISTCYNRSKCNHFFMKCHTRQQKVSLYAKWFHWTFSEFTSLVNKDCELHSHFVVVTLDIKENNEINIEIDLT